MNYNRNQVILLVMKRILLLLPLTWACKPSTGDQALDDSTATLRDTVVAEVTDGELLHDSDYGIYHYAFKINAASQSYSIKFHRPDQKIYVYDNPSESGSPIQEFPLSDAIDYEDGYFAENPDETFALLDFNFDGYKDISIVRMDASSNRWSAIYLFDAAAGTYTKNEKLSELSTVTVDSVDRRLIYYNHGGMAGGWYMSGVVEWVNKEPIIVREEEQTSSEDDVDVFIRTIQIRDTRGEMVVASKVRLEKLDADREKQCLLEGEWTEFDKTPNLMFAEVREKVVRTDGRDGTCD